MPSQFSTIGFSITSGEDLAALASEVADKADRISTPPGEYLKWAPPSGEQLWLSALEAGAIGSVSSVALDGGDAVIAGYTSADWGAPNQGSFDSFVARVSADGELLGVLETGTPQLDRATSVSVDGAGDVFWSREVWNAGDGGFDQAFVARQTLE